MTTIRALLVGIDAYSGDVSQLHGCVNDVDAISALLKARASATGDGLELEQLTNAEATREAFVQLFRSFFALAQPGDQGLLYCSMHGSQQVAPPEHLPFEPDGLNETLVFTDSRTADGRDLADKELAVLVGEVTSRNVPMTIVLDCCHSGAGVRGLESVGVRRAPIDLRPRPASDYLEGTLQAYRGTAGTRSAEQRLGGAAYVLLAACLSAQTAKEVAIAGVTRGALSLSIEQALTSTRGALTYSELHRAVTAAVRRTVQDQNPVLECPDPADAGRLVLGGALSPTEPLLTVYEVSGTWELDAGQVHGLPATLPETPGVELSLHPLTATTLDETTQVGIAVTTRVGASSSAVQVSAEPPLDRGKPYRAVVRRLPAPVVSVRVEGDSPLREQLESALAQAPGVVVTRTDPTLLVRPDLDRPGHLAVVRPGSRRGLTSSHPARASVVTDLVADVVQVGRWLAVEQLVNPSTSLTAHDVVLEVLDTDDRSLALVDGTIEATYRLHGDKWQQPRVRVRVRNDSDRVVFVALLTLSELYGIALLNLEGDGSVPPGGTAYALADDGTHDLYLSVPFKEQRTTDLLKLLVSTRPFHALDTLTQPDMEPPTATRGMTVGDRAIGGSPRPEIPVEDREDWTTREVLLTTVRPGNRVELGQTPSQLAPGVSVTGPAALTASARLMGSIEAGRDALVPLLPSVFADDSASEPYTFLATRAPSDRVDVLEITLAPQTRGTAASVMETAQIELTVDQPLNDAEVVLPIIWDGSDYLPAGLGRTVDGRTRILIDRLPTAGERSLGGSLKILFRKLVLRPVGVTYDWPRLSLVTYAEDGTATYDHDREQILAALAEARSVLLLVHGIIGATDGMAAGVGIGTDSIADHFDTVLAFDYENLHTLIEDTGASLGAALDGLRAELDHELEITAVVHSMGGLVTRYALELQESRGRVQRLVTCGTPHQGSPWSRIEDFALAALGLGLNQLLPLGPPAAVVGQVLGFLTKAVEKLDRTLDQMLTDSELLQTLADPEPSPVPYVVVRGTQPWPATTDDQRAKRIIAKLVTGGFDAVFKGEPNDMAVSISSAAGVGKKWPQPPTVLDAECNHVSYFSSEAGRAAVRRALGLPPS